MEELLEGLTEDVRNSGERLHVGAKTYHTACLSDSQWIALYQRASADELLFEDEVPVEEMRYTDFIRLAWKNEIDVEKVQELILEHLECDSRSFLHYALKQYLIVEAEEGSVLLFPYLFVNAHTHYKLRACLGSAAPVAEMPHYTLRYGSQVNLHYADVHAESVEAVLNMCGGAQIFSLSLSFEQWRLQPHVRQCMWRHGGIGIEPLYMRIVSEQEDHCEWLSRNSLYWRDEENNTLWRILLNGRYNLQLRGTPVTIIDLNSGEIRHTMFPITVAWHLDDIGDELLEFFISQPTYDRRPLVVRRLMQVAPDVDNLRWGHIYCKLLYGRLYRGQAPTAQQLQDMCTVCSDADMPLAQRPALEEYEGGLQFCALKVRVEDVAAGRSAVEAIIEQFLDDFVGNLFGFVHDLDSLVRLYYKVEEDSSWIVLLRFYVTKEQLELMRDACFAFKAHKVEVITRLPLTSRLLTANVPMLGQPWQEIEAEEMTLLKPLTNAAQGMELSVFDSCVQKWPLKIVRTCYEKACAHLLPQHGFPAFANASYNDTDYTWRTQEDRTFHIHWDRGNTDTLVTLYKGFCFNLGKYDSEADYTDDNLPAQYTPMREVTGNTILQRPVGITVLGSNGLVKVCKDGYVRSYRTPQSYTRELCDSLRGLHKVNAYLRRNVVSERFDPRCIEINLREDGTVMYDNTMLLTLLRGDTGAGKTTCVVELIKLWVERGGRVLFVSPRTSLCLQTYARLMEAGLFSVVHWQIRELDQVVPHCKVFITTAHSLHKAVSENNSAASFVSAARRNEEAPLLLVLDEYHTMQLEDVLSTNVLVPERYELALARLLPDAVKQTVLIDANLPPVLVSNFISRISHSLRNYMRVPAHYPAREVKIDSYTAEYSMVRTQKRKATAYISYDNSACKEVIGLRLQEGKKVACFAASVRDLETLKKFYTNDDMLQADEILEISSRNRPVSWADVPRQIADGNIKLLLYTTAASAGLDLAFTDNLQYFDCICLYGLWLPHLSLSQLYQAVSRVRVTQELIFDSEPVLDPFTLSHQADWRAVTEKTPADIIGGYVARQTAIDNAISAVNSAVAPNSQWLLRDFRNSNSSGQDYSHSPFAHSYALGLYFRYLSARSRATFFVGLLLRVGYEVQIIRVAYDKDAAKQVKIATDYAFLEADAALNLQSQNTITTEQYKLSDAARERLQLPTLRKPNEHREVADHLRTYVPAIEEFLSKREASTFQILDIWYYLESLDNSADDEDNIPLNTVAEWKSAIQHIYTLYHKKSEQAKERKELEEQSQRVLHDRTAALEIKRHSMREDMVTRYGILLFCLARIHNKGVLPFSISPDLSSLKKVPSMRALLERRGRIELIHSGAWLDELDQMRNDPSSALYLPFDCHKKRDVKNRRTVWTNYKEFVRSALGVPFSTASRWGIRFDGPEVDILQNLFTMWQHNRSPNKYISPLKPLDVDFLEHCIDDYVRASALPPDEALLEYLHFDSAAVTQKKRKLE